jgi:hypothetical protein
MNYRRAIAVLLLIVAAICGSLEALTRILLPRMSRLQAREIGERRAALSPARGPGKRLLIVGNSLLLEDVDFPALHAAMSPEWDAQRFSVDQTLALDWYYGLRRLFKQGARFDAVAITFTPQQLVAASVRGSYSAWRLFSPGDIVEVARDANLSPTQSGDLLLSSVSEFYGMRVELRKLLLGRFLPALPDLMRNFISYPAWEPNPEELFVEARKTLARFRELGDQNQAEILLIVPPIPAVRDGADSVLRAAESTGIRVIAPIRSGSLPLSVYRDGFHLNSEGAALFTPALAGQLRQAVSDCCHSLK